jgi:hypothetical protein
MEFSPLGAQARKGMRARDFLDEMAVDIQEHASIVVLFDNVLVPDFFV